jgi:hypothetical protein
MYPKKLRNKKPQGHFIFTLKLLLLKKYYEPQVNRNRHRKVGKPTATLLR